MKNRILFSKKALSTNKKQDKPLTASDINSSSEQYYRYGTLLPATITGSKSYMKNMVTVVGYCSCKRTW